MRSDDELLSHIRQQAGVRRQRRQRALGGAAAAAVVLLLGAGALAASSDEPDETVKAEDGGSTTTEATTTTEAAPTTDGTTSTTSTTTTTEPPESTTTEAPATTAVPPTTTTAPPALPSEIAVGDGITVEATATGAERGRVTLSIRIRADHGSHPGGSVSWEGAQVLYGYFAEEGPTDCDDLIDDDPNTNPGPGLGAGAVDATFTVLAEVDPTATEVILEIRGSTSWCSADEANATVILVVPLGG